MKRKEAIKVLMERYDIPFHEANTILPQEGDSTDPLSKWWCWSPERMHQVLTELEGWADDRFDQEFPDPLEGARLGE